MSQSAFLSFATQARQALLDKTIHQLEIKNAGAGWGLIMQSGVRVPCTTGITLDTLLRNEFSLAPDSLSQIDVLLLDGKPVDDPTNVRISEGSRLALAAGLPGIAGLAMKSNSPVRGLRPGITHKSTAWDTEPPASSAGSIELALFSLALPLLACHFMARGIALPTATLVRYLRPALQGTCRLDGVSLSLSQIRDRLAGAPKDTLLFVSAFTTQQL